MQWLRRFDANSRSNVRPATGVLDHRITSLLADCICGTETIAGKYFRGMIFSREDIFARGYFREKIFSREDIFAGRYFRVNSIFAKISSRENISNSLFAKFSSRENKVLYSIRNFPSQYRNHFRGLSGHDAGSFNVTVFISMLSGGELAFPLIARRPLTRHCYSVYCLAADNNSAREHCTCSGVWRSVTIFILNYLFFVTNKGQWNEKKRSKCSGWECCYANKNFGTFGVEMRASGQKLVKFCTHPDTHTTAAKLVVRLDRHL